MEGEILRFSTELCWRRCVFTPFYFLCCFASFAPVTVACVSLWLLWPSRSFQQQTVPAGFVVSSVAQGRIWEPTSCSPSSHPGAHVSSQGQQHNQQQHNQQEQQKQKHQQHQQHQQQRHQQQQQQGYCSVNVRRCRPFMAFFCRANAVPQGSGKERRNRRFGAPPPPCLPFLSFFLRNARPEQARIWRGGVGDQLDLLVSMAFLHRGQHSGVF